MTLTPRERSVLIAIESREVPVPFSIWFETVCEARKVDVTYRGNRTKYLRLAERLCDRGLLHIGYLDADYIYSVTSKGQVALSV